MLVPRPRVNLVLYHGFLAPRAAWRAEVVPRPVPQATADARQDASEPDVTPRPEARKAAEVARAGYERELELAATIQADLFPAQLPRVPGYDLAARNRPARRCGGDYDDASRNAGTGDDESVLPNEKDDEFGESRLTAIVRDARHPPSAEIVSRVFEAIDQFAGTAPQFDDITLMILRRLGD